jgi:DUF2075 family protein
MRGYFSNTVQSFIDRIENGGEDLPRDEFETCILASNILRKALDKGLKNDIKVGAEIECFGSGRKRVDLMLIGENSTGDKLVYLMEFKAWSEVNHINNDQFEANMFGTKAQKFKLRKPKDQEFKRCPLYQCDEYISDVINNKTSSTMYHVSLVFPNLKKDAGRMFIQHVERSISSTPEVTLIFHDKIIELVDKLLDFFIDFQDCTLPMNWFGKSVGMALTPSPKTIPIPNNLNSSNLNSSTSRHGWIGPAKQFIREVLENNFIFNMNRTLYTAEKKHILYSTNQLSWQLRQLKNEVLESIIVVIEYDLRGPRADAVVFFTAKENDIETFEAALVVEMKGWTDGMGLEAHERSSSFPGGQYYSDFSYPSGDRHVPSKHPVLQVIEYVEALRSEGQLGSGLVEVHGTVWFHNVTGKLEGELSELVSINHCRYKSQSSSTKKLGLCDIFDHDVTGRKTSIITKSLLYEKPKTPTKAYSLHEKITEISQTISNTHECNSEHHKLLSAKPILSVQVIQNFYEDAAGKMEKILSREQKKLVNKIITEVKKADKDDNNLSKVIFVEGDAGTGKTAVSLTAMALCLNMDIKQPLDPDLAPHLIACSTAASDDLSLRCLYRENMISAPQTFIVSYQHFVSGPRYYLGSLHYSRWDSNQKLRPRLLIFDEAQLLENPPDGTMKDIGVGMLKKRGVSSEKLESFANSEFTKSRKFPGQKKWSLAPEKITKLADVVVIFCDPKQSTKATSFGNITRENVVQCLEDSQHLTRKLSKSYRQEPQYTRMIKDFLYNEKQTIWKILSRFKKREFKFKIFQERSDFFTNFDETYTSDPSSGIVAGYTREWISAKDPTKYDWDFGNGQLWQWNLSPGRTWISDATERKRRIGYFGAVQGNELNNIFVIIGRDLKVNVVQKIGANISEHQDESKCVSGSSTPDDVKLQTILNQYWVLLTRGRKSCSVWCEDPEVGKHLEKIAKQYGYDSQSSKA